MAVVGIPKNVIYAAVANAAAEEIDVGDQNGILERLANRFPDPTEADRIELIQAATNLANDLFEKMHNVNPNVRNTAKILYHLVKAMIDVLDQIVKDDVLVFCCGATMFLRC